jgi:hypothetical protein
MGKQIAVKFNESTHTYSDINGVVIPSVTQVIRSVIGKENSFISIAKQGAMNRGSDVHRICHCINSNIPIDVEEFEQYDGYTQAYKSFIKDFNVYVIESEKMYCSEINKLIVAGTLDLVCKINGINYVVDIKTSEKLKDDYAIQVEMYRKIIDIDVEKSAIIQLFNDGSYIFADSINILPDAEKQMTNIVNAYKRNEKIIDVDIIPANEDMINYASLFNEHKAILEKLKKLEKQTKAILSAWQVGSANKPTDDTYNTGFVPKNKKNKTNTGKPNFNTQVSKNMQDPKGEYLWLFSGLK